MGEGVVVTDPNLRDGGRGETRFLFPVRCLRPAFDIAWFLRFLIGSLRNVRTYIDLTSSPRSYPVITRSKTFSVGLPHTMCAFVCGLSGEEIIVFVLPFKDDAWYKFTIFLTICVFARSLIMRMRRDNKNARVRFRAQTAICDQSCSQSSRAFWSAPRHGTQE